MGDGSTVVDLVFLPYRPSVAASALKGSDALAAAGLSLALFVVSGPLLVPLGAWGIALGQVLAFALPALLVAGTRSGGFAAIGARSCAPAALLGAGLIGCGLWYWNVQWIAPIMVDWGNPEQAEKWGQRVAVHARPLAETLLLFALVPAVCEELLHRGVIAPALAKRLGLVPALVLSALLFGLMHLSLARLLPTGLLGAAAAYLRLTTGSLLPAILLHFLHNAWLLVAAQQGWSLPSQLTIPSLILSGLGLGMAHKYSQSR